MQSFVIIHTGVANFTTKDVVQMVKENFSDNDKIWNSFDTISNKIIESIEKNRIKSKIDWRH